MHKCNYKTFNAVITVIYPKVPLKIWDSKMNLKNEKKGNKDTL